MVSAWCVLSISTRSLKVLGVTVSPTPTVSTNFETIWSFPILEAKGATYEVAAVALRKTASDDPRLKWLYNILEGKGGGRTDEDHNLEHLAKKALRGDSNSQDVMSLARGILHYQRVFFGD